MNEPLSPLTMSILLALAEAEQHGYALMQEVGRMTGSTPGTGSLYAALERLRTEGLVTESARAPGPTEDSRRRYFQITARGRARARAEANRMLQVVHDARIRGLLSDPARP